MNVKDKGLPIFLAAERNPAKIAITVIRNYHRPLFFKNEYKVTVPQTKPVGQLVQQVTATDEDTQVRSSLSSVLGFLIYYLC